MKQIVFLVLGILWSMRAWADDWPQWRGPNRDGVWSESKVLQTFPADGFKVRWRANIGPGISSPVVAVGRAYVADVEFTPPKVREHIRCFDERTGASLWTHGYEVTYPSWLVGMEHMPGPRATPLVANGKIYSVGAMGHLFCLDAATGAVSWQKDLVAEYHLNEFAGSCCSPLIEGNLLILALGTKPEPLLIAVDKHSGRAVWQALSERFGSSSPVVINAGGVRQLIFWSGETVTSLAPETGKLYWSERMPSDATHYAVATPIQAGADRLLVSRLMFGFEPGVPAAKVLWPQSSKASDRFLSSTSTPLCLGQHVYSADASGRLVCLEANTGKQLWQTEAATDVHQGCCLHLTANGDSVLIANDRGELIRARLTPEGY